MRLYKSNRGDIVCRTAHYKQYSCINDTERKTSIDFYALIILDFIQYEGKLDGEARWYQSLVTGS